METAPQQLHVHLHFDGGRVTPRGHMSKRNSTQRLLAVVLDVGFYILMAAAVMSSLCLFLSLYSTDLDPDANSYRAQFMRYTPQIKRLFGHRSQAEEMAWEMKQIDQQVARTSGTSLKNSTSARSQAQFALFVKNLQNESLPVVMHRHRLNDKSLRNSISCGGTNVVKIQTYRGFKQAGSSGFNGLMPETDPLPDGTYSSCAVVGNSGSLLEDQHGQEIDEHEGVIRFNAARISGFEQFVGSKTSIRLLNSPDAVWPKEGGEATITTMRNHDQMNVWQKAVERNKMGEGPAYATDPEFLCHTWDWVQHTGDKPSSGLVGVVMAMKLCKQVHLYGFQSSNYFGKFSRPHYYDWERPKKGREKVHPFAREIWLYRQLDRYGYITIH